MNSDLSHASDCVFYDSELRLFKRSFKECYEILKNIDKRAERRQTVQISKSLFDYCERTKDFKVAPQKFYDFRLDEYRICVFKYKGRFSVLTVNFEFNHPNEEISDFVGSGHLYYSCTKLSDCVVHFLEIVDWFLSSYSLKMMDDGEIPF